MAFVDWSEKYSVCNEELDKHQQRLFIIVNDLHKAILGKHGKKEIRHIVDRLIEHPKSHFAVEEQLLESCGYPHRQAHKQGHENLTRQLSELDQGFRETGKIIVCDVYAFLMKEWLFGHILKDDRGYAPYLANRLPASGAKTIPYGSNKNHIR